MRLLSLTARNKLLVLGTVGDHAINTFLKSSDFGGFISEIVKLNYLTVK